MKIWISTYRQGINLPTGWQGEAEPPASLQMLLTRLPESDKHYSLIIKRCLYDRCMLAMHRVNEHGADLVIDELEEEQARSLALAYLQQHDDLCRNIAQNIQGQSAEAKADVTAIEKTLLQYIEKYPVKSVGVMIDTVSSSLHDVAAISKVTALLRNYYFSTSEEEKLVLSDNGSSFTFDKADIVLNGQEIPKERERKNNKVLFVVGSLLALSIIVCAVANLCGTDSKKKDEPPTEQPVLPVNPPAPQTEDAASSSETQISNYENA